MAHISPDVARCRARVAGLTRSVRNGERPADDPDLDDAQRELRTVRAQKYIAEILAQAPPLNDEQRQRLAELLRPVREPAVA